MFSRVLIPFTLHPRFGDKLLESELNNAYS